MSLHPPYTMLKLTNKFGNTCPVPFMGWGERLGICELEKAPEMQKCTKTFVHDCRFNVLKIDIVLTDVIVMWLFFYLRCCSCKEIKKEEESRPTLPTNYLHLQWSVSSRIIGTWLSWTRLLLTDQLDLYSTLMM